MSSRLFVVCGLLAGVLVVSSGSSSAESPDAVVVDPAEIALAFLSSESTSASFTESSDLVVAGLVPTVHNDVTHVYVQQQFQGIDVFGAIANVAVLGDGSVVNDASRLVAAFPNAATPDIGAVQAAAFAADALDLETSSSFSVIQPAAGADRSQTLSDGGISLTSIPARLVHQPVDAKSWRLAWELGIETVAGEDWWQIRIDAATGEELDRNNLIVHDDFGGGTDHDPGVIKSAAVPVTQGAPGLVADGSSYRVYAQPLEAPIFGARTVVNQPADDTASPFGWHDTDGADGAESTLTLGNNVSAYTDINNDDVPDPGSQPDGGAGLDFDFDFPIDLTMPPSTYSPAAVTNLFYWNNIAHDFLYSYGFDEAAGNFQVNNYGNGGLGSDAVNAEAQDAASLAPVCVPGNCTRNNANFATPPDGQAPRMQMYLWDDSFVNPATLDRDGDFDNGIIMHEYGHGLSNRLTGGPAAAVCLNNQEHAGEGWSDYLSLVSTMRSTDTATQARGIGTYALGQPTTGPGIRAFPYSTDLTVDPRTYDSVKTASVPHGVGSTFAAMLWEMTWALIDQYGFDADLANGSGGNNVATQLVVDGLKLQPCSPGFVDARDAILAADTLNNVGANTCLIWEAFAKRGLGFSADQGLSSSRADGTEAFDLPPNCPLVLTKTADVSTAQAGGAIAYTLTTTNTDSTENQTSVVVTDAVPTGTSYVGGSAECGGTEAAGVMTFNIGTLTPGQSQACSFTVRTDASPFTELLVDDGFEPDASAWTIDHADGTLDWGIDVTTPRSGTNAMFASNASVVTDQYMALTTPVPIAATTQLSFWHRYNLEADGANPLIGYDGGVVEISTDGGTTWIDLGPQIVQNGYDRTIDACCSSPLAGRLAFTGNQPTYRETVVDLSSFAGSTAQIRFRLGTDSSVAREGWWVDDVRLGTIIKVTNVANATSTTHTTSSQSVVTKIVAPMLSAAPTAVTGVPGDGQVAVSWTAPAVAPSNSAPTGYTVTSAPGGNTCATSGPTTCTVSGLANGTAYTFTVTATNLAGIGPASAASSPVIPMAPVEDVVSLDPARLLDTRPNGETIDNEFDKLGTVPAGGMIELDILGRGGAPNSGVAAVILNVTMIRPDGNGFVTIFPCGTRPDASSMNAPNGGGVVANEVIAKLSPTGTICLYTSTPTNLAADITGYIPTASAVVSLDPARLLDTRPNGETIDNEFDKLGTVPAGGMIELDILGRGGAPNSGVAAVILNVTMIRPDGNGFVTIFPCGTRPDASSMNAPNGGGVVANEVIAKLSPTGTICLYTSTPTNLAADITGYIPTASAVVSLDPARLLDTRPNGETIDNEFDKLGTVPAGGMIELDILGRGGAPNSGVAAVILNVTMIRPDGNGFVTIFPCGTRPDASSMNAPNGGGVVANEVIAKLSPTGTICLYTSTPTNLAADITGYIPT